MNKIEIGVIAAVIVSIVSGVFYLGRLDNRVTQIEGNGIGFLVKEKELALKAIREAVAEGKKSLTAPVGTIISSVL